MAHPELYSGVRVSRDLESWGAVLGSPQGQHEVTAALLWIFVKLMGKVTLMENHCSIIKEQNTMTIQMGMNVIIIIIFYLSNITQRQKANTMFITE